MFTKYQKAVDNIVNYSLHLNKGDKLAVITDKDTLNIGKAIAVAGEDVCKTELFVIEDYVERPAKIFPQSLIRTLVKFEPTASIYAAQGKNGELQNFRFPLMRLLTEKLNVRHGHMIGVNENVMLDGMSQNYNPVHKTVKKVLPILKRAKTIHITCPKGTDIKLKFSKKFRWVGEDGRILKQGEWCNLPAGECFTFPKSLSGKIVAHELGDYFSKKYGLLTNPVIFNIKNSFITKVEGKNPILVSELNKYLSEYENGNRVGELGIGCLVGLKKLIGNLLQDEKFPGVHVAFGNPYPEKTKADWQCKSHIDVIPLRVTVKVNGKLLLKNGKFVDDIFH